MRPSSTLIAMDCIEWTKSFGSHGYGNDWHEGTVTVAHRVAYVKAHNLKLSDIKGVVIRHTCDNRKCVNPEHLLPGTHADNVRDKVERGRSYKGDHNTAKTHCPQGHPYDEVNTYISKVGARHCKTCTRETVYRRRAEGKK